MTLSIVILAAGQGKRMRSELPKVLHCIAGKPLLQHVVSTAEKLAFATPPIVVYGHQGDVLRHRLADLNVIWVEQKQQWGTGHALQQALPQLPNHHRVLVLYGDVPLISQETLEKLITTTPSHHIGMITAHMANPTGFGRIIRNHDHAILRIVEEKDLNNQQHINEINTGIYLFPEQFLSAFLPKLKQNNAQQEYYLTDMIHMAVENNIAIHAIQPQTNEEIQGVNDRVQLAELERIYQRQEVEKLMRQGVTLLDPNRFDLRGSATIAQDVTIDINVVLEGNVTIGSHSRIGPHCVLRNVIIGDHCEIKAHSVIEGAEIGTHCLIGPFARLRPGTVVSNHTHIGNFVEIKNSFINESSKVNHLSYIGDSDVGKYVNVGAGTITCNYDGANKHRTTIGDSVFIGSNTALVAPIHIGQGATIGAGSTLTHSAPEQQLTLSRARQRSIQHWQRPQKKESKPCVE